MANTAASIILIAGGITFTNEWYQTKQINWKVPIATVLAAAIFDGLAKLDDKAAIGVSVIVLIGAFVNKVDGKSIADLLVESFGGKNSSPPKTVKPKAEIL
jgi:putative effector of murein hydrolase